jgi:hypothetical protein
VGEKRERSDAKLKAGQPERASFTHHGGVGQTRSWGAGEDGWREEEEMEKVEKTKAELEKWIAGRRSRAEMEREGREAV